MPISTKTFLDKRPEAACDTECYIDYWSIGFKNLATGKKVILEKYDGQDLDRTKIAKILRKFRIYTFNGLGYDLMMIALAMAGASNAKLKEANDAIFTYRLPLWKFLDRYKCVLPDYLDHIDLMEVAPGVRLSLKKYGARMNMPWLQELPIDPSEPVGAARRPQMRKYLGNDLDTTGALALGLREEIDIRNEISVEYGVDVRSKSDAQIAETLIGREVEKITGFKPQKPTVKTFSFKYEPPAFLRFKTPLLQGVFDEILATRFFVSAEDPDDKKSYGVVRLPQSIKDLNERLRIGGTNYKMGIGGLHSQEKRRSFVADENTLIEDRDVRAYYPRLMLACGYVPEALGQTFLGVFTKFVDLRDSYKEKAAKLKKIGDMGQSMKYKKRSDSFKIVNNGTFGKTGSPYAIVYSPRLMISTTLTGQLSLLMLIEELELNGFNVISANTDGIVTVIPRERYGMFACIVFDWELATSFTTEAVRYLGVYSRDVNSYVAVVEDPKKSGQVLMVPDKAGVPQPEVKRKGLFAKAGLQAKHDPTFDICSTAVIEYLLHGTDIEDTIRACTDFTQFIGVKQVGKVKLPDGTQKEGGTKDGEYLGKMVRWYHGAGERGFIAKRNGARVAGTTGAVPCMNLPEEFPDDIDYDWYVREAYARLDDIGLKTENPRLDKFGYRTLVLPGQKTTHIVDMATRAALCGRSEKNMREPWQEVFESEYVGLRMCKTCREERGIEDEDDDGENL